MPKKRKKTYLSQIQQITKHTDITQEQKAIVNTERKIKNRIDSHYKPPLQSRTTQPKQNANKNCQQTVEESRQNNEIIHKLTVLQENLLYFD